MLTEVDGGDKSDTAKKTKDKNLDEFVTHKQWCTRNGI